MFDNSKRVYYNINRAQGHMEALSQQESGLAVADGAFRVHIDSTSKQIFDVGMSCHFNTVRFEQGEKVHSHFKARSKSANLIAVIMQKDRALEYKPCWTKFLVLKPEWETHDRSYAVGGFGCPDLSVPPASGYPTSGYEVAWTGNRQNKF